MVTNSVNKVNVGIIIVIILILWSLIQNFNLIPYMVTNIVYMFILLNTMVSIWLLWSLIYHMLKFEIIKTIRTTIATHDSELDCQYLRVKYSIVQHLPRLAIIEIDNYSYCSVKQYIADCLGKGYLPASQLPDNAKHSKYITTRAKLLYGDTWKTF